MFLTVHDDPVFRFLTVLLKRKYVLSDGAQKHKSALVRSVKASRNCNLNQSILSGDRWQFKPISTGILKTRSDSPPPRPYNPLTSLPFTQTKPNIAQSWNLVRRLHAQLFRSFDQKRPKKRHQLCQTRILTY